MGLHIANRHRWAPQITDEYADVVTALFVASAKGNMMSSRPQEQMGYGLFGRCTSMKGSGGSVVTTTEIRITNSVGRGGKNIAADVKTIQKALNRVPADQGRPLPSLSVDGLNGPKTEKAIYVFQKQHFGVMQADARVDPNHQTIAKLNELQPGGQAGAGSGGSGLGGASSFVPTGKKESDTIARVESSVALAEKWALKAVVELLNALEHVEGKDGRKESYDLVNRCFMIDSLSDAKNKKQAINYIIKIFNRMPRARRAVSPFVRKGGDCFTEDGKLIAAQAIPGGYHHSEADNKRVKICVKHMNGKDIYFMTDAMVHEMAHLVGPKNGPKMIMHGGRADPAYGLAALSLTHREALISASNYAWLAWLARLPKSQWQTNTG